MNYDELTKLMKKAGWQFVRNGKGSHKIWKHPERPPSPTMEARN